VLLPVPRLRLPFSLLDQPYILYLGPFVPLWLLGWLRSLPICLGSLSFLDWVLVLPWLMLLYKTGRALVFSAGPFGMPLRICFVWVLRRPALGPLV
jgi:hypothetical protein